MTVKKEKRERRFGPRDRIISHPVTVLSPYASGGASLVPDGSSFRVTLPDNLPIAQESLEQFFDRLNTVKDPWLAAWEKLVFEEKVIIDDTL